MKWDLQTSGSHPLASTVNENVQILFSFPGGKLAHPVYEEIREGLYQWLLLGYQVTFKDP